MKQFVNQTLHSNLHMMEEAAAEDGDVKPLTNGIDKEEVCTVLISTDEQGSDSKNDSVDLSFCKIPAKRLTLHS